MLEVVAIVWNLARGRERGVERVEGLQTARSQHLYTDVNEQLCAQWEMNANNGCK